MPRAYPLVPRPSGKYILLAYSPPPSRRQWQFRVFGGNHRQIGGGHGYNRRGSAWKGAWSLTGPTIPVYVLKAKRWTRLG